MHQWYKAFKSGPSTPRTAVAEANFAKAKELVLEYRYYDIGTILVDTLEIARLVPKEHLKAVAEDIMLSRVASDSIPIHATHQNW